MRQMNALDERSISIGFILRCECSIVQYSISTSRERKSANKIDNRYTWSQ